MEGGSEWEKYLRFGNSQGGRRLELTIQDVAHVLSIWTGIPMGKMTEDEVSRVLRLADILSLVGPDNRN